MKQLLFVLCCLTFVSCSAQRVKVQKANGGDVVTNCPDCVQVRIRNTGKDPISKLVLTAEGGEYHFDGVKAGKTGKVKLVKKLCSCGYGMDIHYVRSASNSVVITRNCQNVVQCSDFLHGSVVIEVNADKLPQDLKSKEAKRLNVNVNIRQQ